MEGLGDDEAAVRGAARQALQGLGQPALRPLSKALAGHQQPPVRNACAELLGKMCPGAWKDDLFLAAEVIRTLGQGLNDRESGVALTSAQSLGGLGKWAWDGEPELLAAFDGKQPSAVRAAVVVMGVAKPPKVRLIERLSAACKSDPDETLRKMAGAALEGIWKAHRAGMAKAAPPGTIPPSEVCGSGGACMQSDGTSASCVKCHSP